MYTSTQLVWTLPNVSYVEIIDTLTSNTDAISKASVPPLGLLCAQQLSLQESFQTPWLHQDDLI